MTVIGPQKLRQYPSIKGIALRLADAKPIPSTIQSFGIYRINHYTMIQKKIHNSPVGLFDGRPKLNPLCAALVEPAPELSQPFRVSWTFLSFIFLPLSSATYS